jgi:acetylornithine deacetylase
VDEEKNGPDGSIYLLDEVGLTADYEITCEPTGWTHPDGHWGMGVAIANAGHFLVELSINGRQAHLWRPDVGVNPIDKAHTLLARLDKFRFTHTPPAHYGGTPPRVTALRISAGEPRQLQFTPPECHIVLGLVGLVPGITRESVLADLEAEIAAAQAEDPELEVSLRPYPGALFVSGTREEHLDTEPVASLRAAYHAIRGEEPEMYRKNAFNDTIRFSERGIPSITFGPGEDGWPPINEYIRIEKSVAATRILALSVLGILGLREIMP